LSGSDFIDPFLASSFRIFHEKTTLSMNAWIRRFYSNCIFFIEQAG